MHVLQTYYKKDNISSYQCVPKINPTLAVKEIAQAKHFFFLIDDDSRNTPLHYCMLPQLKHILIFKPRVMV